VTDPFDRLPASLREALRDEPVPKWTAPTLATLTDERFSDPGWIFERKFDGERCLAFRDGARVRLLSRNRQSLNATYPELAAALSQQKTSRFVVDGEVVAFEGRRTSFARLQGRLGITNPHAARKTGIVVFYYLFDLLHLNGRSTTALPLAWRKRLLRSAVQFDDPLRYTTHRMGAGESAYSAACARGDEGVIAKLADARYAGRRSTDWLKFKCVAEQEFVIGGYTAPHGSRVGLGALLVGYHDDGDLVYAGKVGTGFDDATLRGLHDRLCRIEQDTSPFIRGPARVADSHWVCPQLVAQLGFTEWTRGGKLRHPRYLGLRTDKDAADVVAETR
jgi:DNA ligase D-like protein (predicted ligase)